MNELIMTLRQVWNRRMVRDDFIGQILLDANTLSSTMQVDKSLKGRKENVTATVPGRMTLEYTTEEDLLLI